MGLPVKKGSYFPSHISFYHFLLSNTQTSSFMYCKVPSEKNKIKNQGQQQAYWQQDVPHTCPLVISLYRRVLSMPATIRGQSVRCDQALCSKSPRATARLSWSQQVLVSGKKCSSHCCISSLPIVRLIVNSLLFRSNYSQCLSLLPFTSFLSPGNPERDKVISKYHRCFCFNLLPSAQLHLKPSDLFSFQVIPSGIQPGTDLPVMSTAFLWLF